VQEPARGWVNNPRFHDDVKTMIFGVFACVDTAMEHYQKYKEQHGLMDFTDQESGVLKLLEQKNPFFRDSLKGRLSLLLVDEFQDTSPVQLAIFLELDRLCGNSFWVGDPKQSIYGFRGSDPMLMNTAADYFSKKPGAESIKPLSDSWRSKELLVDFVNAVFKKVFHAMPENKVCLNIPAERKEAAKGGALEAWLLEAKNNKDADIRLAVAVQALLNNAADCPNKELKPGDIAILCRSNLQCENVSEALEHIGIRASTARGLLVKTAVCRLALAALRYLADKNDTLAMLELLNLLPDTAGSNDWLAKLLSDREAFFNELRSKPVFQDLDTQRKKLRHWTPLEALEYAIEESGAPGAAGSWPNPALAMANLDKLRQTCVQYLDLCRARRNSASLPGYLAYLDASATPEAEGADDQTVQVLTYHAAKGLEWPVVILFSLGAEPRGSAFDLCAKTEGVFDPQNPLKNRTLHFWPNPIPGSQKSEELNDLINDCPEQQEAVDREIKERQRLLYVGFTRARDVLILAVQRGKELNTAWLDELTDADGKRLINLPSGNTKGAQVQRHTLKVGAAEIPMTIREYTENYAAAQLARSVESRRRPAAPADLPDYPPYRYSPSTLEADAEELSKITVSLAGNLGERIAVKGTPDYTSLGDAVHNFLAVEQGKRSATEWQAVAQRLLTRYGVTDVMDPAGLPVIYDRLARFIKTRYPEAKIHREWPISLREANNQVMLGWIDLLLELDNGFVIIDHKTFPGAEAEERARLYSPQLKAYRRAVEAATGKTVLAMLIHMPVIGKIFDVR
jgi:ATP-dependent exoDNAse (exonuclease V) beta subunit